MFALNNTCFTHMWCGNYPTANAQATEVVALADEKGTMFWKAYEWFTKVAYSPRRAKPRTRFT